MTWFSCKDKLPPKKEIVLLFRTRKGKYSLWRNKKRNGRYFLATFSYYGKEGTWTYLTGHNTNIEYDTDFWSEIEEFKNTDSDP